MQQAKFARLFAQWSVAFALLVLLVACVRQVGTVGRTAGQPVDDLPTLAPATLAAGEKLRVVATINILADAVQRVGGDQIELTTLLPVGADPHSYSAAPGDLRTLEQAHVIFMVDRGLEESMLSVLQNHEGQGALVAVNSGLTLMTMDEEEEGQGGLDPHTWMSVPSVQHWVGNIEQGLRALDPAHAADYQTAAQAYIAELAALDEELQRAAAAIPVERRKLVTDHDALGYFAAHYKFTVIGSVIQSFSTLSASSAQELAALQEQISAESVPAIFVGTTVNPTLEEQIANDVGVQVVKLYTESLSEADGPAATYVDLMRYDMNAIVAALK